MKMLSMAAALAVVLLTQAGCKGDSSQPEYWTKALQKAPKPKNRERVLTDLRTSGKLGPAFVPVLQAQLASEKSAEVKAVLARMLGELKDPSSVQPLIDALDLGNSDAAGNRMNKEITAALAAIGDKQALPTLLKLMRSRNDYVRIEAIDGLGALRAKEAVQPLIALAEDQNGEAFVSKKAIIALGNIGDPSAIPTLTKMMFKERRGMSFYAESSFSLYQIGSKSADAMLPILEGRDQQLLSWAREAGLIEAALYAKAAQVAGDLHDPRAEKALLQRLRYDNPMLDVKLFVRMRAADALGRLRSKEAAKVLAGMLGEEEATARAEYVRALVKIGSPESVPALAKAAASGPWDARESAIIGLAMLGEAEALAQLDKLAEAEPAATAAECKDNPDYRGCGNPAALGKQHQQVVVAAKARVEAGTACKQEAPCSIGKLDDANPGVRERAALELGRSGKAEAVQPLLKHVSDSNLDARLAAIQGVDWLVSDSPAAAAQAKAGLVALRSQMASEKGKTEFVKVNEDLRRLAVLIDRP